MNTISCPNCGAPVTFRSAASVMAVCGFCKSTLIKDADSVRNIGRMADVLEDFSPIQLGTSGTIDGRGFTVVGRIQLRYPAGFWNEWYVVDDHGDGAWLSDGSGQYTFTRAVDRSTLPGATLPRFEALAAGSRLDLGRASDGSTLLFIAGDVRAAQCTGGQGELPFAVGAGYAARVADFRRGNEFVTLDYSDESGVGAAVPVASNAPNASGDPIVYRGRSITLDELKPQLLRDPETITDAAGRVKGKVTDLQCPSCGASIAFSPGATTHLLCQTCHASLDVAGPVAEVMAAAKRVEAVKTSLPLGAKATIGGTSFTVIGLMRRAEISADAGEWTEYLMYAPQRGFLWLVETDDGWERSHVLDAWPYWVSTDRAMLDGDSYDKLYDYQAVVKYAAGAFNWRVEVGDVDHVTEFKYGIAKLAAESDETELNWSRSTPLDGQGDVRLVRRPARADRRSAVADRRAEGRLSTDREVADDPARRGQRDPHPVLAGSRADHRDPRDRRSLLPRVVDGPRGPTEGGMTMLAIPERSASNDADGDARG